MERTTSIMELQYKKSFCCIRILFRCALGRGFRMPFHALCTTACHSFPIAVNAPLNPETAIALLCDLRQVFIRLIRKRQIFLPLASQAAPDLIFKSILGFQITS